MKKNKIFLIVVVLLLVLLNSASFVSAQYENIEMIPGKGNTRTSDFCTYIGQIINFGFATIGILAMFMLCVGAYQYLMAAGNIAKVESAKATIASALLGLLLGLTSFIILRTINPDLVKCDLKISGTGTGDGTKPPPTGNCYGGKGACKTECGSGDDNKGQDICQSGQTCCVPKSDTGKCEPVKSGPCSVDNLKSTCFGDNAEKASKICNKESAGNPLAGGDRCSDDGRNFSWGLFQINLTCHDIGLRCTGAFNPTGSCGGMKCKNVADEVTYNQCVQKAQNIDFNIAYACQLSGNGSNFSKDWKNSSQDCGIP